MKLRFTHNLSASLRTLGAATCKNRFVVAFRRHATHLLIVPALALGGLALHLPASAQVIYGSAFAKGPFDRDGFPVVVSDRLAEIQKAYGKKPNSPEYRKAFERLYNDLPYAPQTRQLFAKAGLLLEQLHAAKDSKIAAQTTLDLQAIQRQLELDAIYQRLVQAGLVRSNREQQERDRSRPAATPAATPSTPKMIAMPLVAHDYPATAAQPWQTVLQPGDILLETGHDPLEGFVTHLVYANHYDHCGTYMGGGIVFDSKDLTPYGRNGVWFRSLEEWKTPGIDICILRDNQRTQPQVIDAVNWATDFYGTNGRTPYNWLYPDKVRDDALYCSQLVWKIHSLLGVDMDSNDFWYQALIYFRWHFVGLAASIPGVAPDEIRASPFVSVVWEGRNR